jgi:OsmC-like protein
VIGAQSGLDREASVQARERAVRGICRPLAGAPPWERDGYRTRGRTGLVAQSLTTSIVYVAAARKVQLTSVESTLTGDMDVRGALGVSDEPRNGFERISASFRVTGNAPEAKLRDVVERARERSAVYDMVTNGVPVAVEVTTY